MTGAELGGDAGAQGERAERRGRVLPNRRQHRAALIRIAQLMESRGDRAGAHVRYTEAHANHVLLAERDAQYRQEVARLAALVERTAD